MLREGINGFIVGSIPLIIREEKDSFYNGMIAISAMFLVCLEKFRVQTVYAILGMAPVIFMQFVKERSVKNGDWNFKFYTKHS